MDVAARLLSTGGEGAVTTRAVAAAAGLQPPTIYRLFGDKDGLLDAVAEHVFETYLAGKTMGGPSDDAVADLDAGWSTHIDFGLANPALHLLLLDPERGRRSPAIAAGKQVLRERVHRVALAGRLAVPEDRAVEMMHAAGTGVVATLLAAAADERDPALADAVWSAIRAAIIDEEPSPSDDERNTARAAISLRAGLPDAGQLSAAERLLLGEWLDRIADG